MSQWCGNQTWAALRDDTPVDPGTDGREPHTYVETGAEARWDTESEFSMYYDTVLDLLMIPVVSMGDEPIDDFKATVRITPPGTPAKVVEVRIGAPSVSMASDDGQLHMVEIPKFLKKFPADDPSTQVEDYLIEAYLPKELGGDLYKNHLTHVL